MKNNTRGYFANEVRHCLLMLLMLGLGPLHAWAGGNVVSCWSIEQSKKEKWFIAELVPESATFSLDGNVFEIAEAWVEQAHRTDYILLTIPKRVGLPFYWVCMRIKENTRGRYISRQGKEFFLSFESVERTKPGHEGFGAVFYKDKDPVLFVYRDEKLLKEYAFSIVTVATREQKRTRDLVLRSK